MACTAVCAFLLTAGCRGRDAASADVVYVVAKQTYLRDRIAPVSSRVAQVSNGEKLEVIAHDRRFYNVRTPDGKTGWLDDHAVIDQPTYEAFLKLRKDHATDAVVGTGVLHDELFVHIAPGRDTDRFFLLPEGDKLQLLQRASVRKLNPQESFRAQQQKSAEARAAYAAERLAELAAKGKGPTPGGPIVLGKAAAPPAAPEDAFVPGPRAVDPNAPAPEYEDWWLVRDAHGQVGWLLGRRLDVDVPDEVVRYAEGKRIVGAYLLAKVPDDQSPFPDKQAPEYVMVLSTYGAGMPFDYTRVRALVWNVRKHRYEGGLRMNDVVGYLPVTIGHEVLDAKGIAVPTFTLKLGAAGATPTLDPNTGRPVPVPTAEIKYRLDGETVRRAAMGTAPMPELASSASMAEQQRQAARHRKHR